MLIKMAKSKSKNVKSNKKETVKRKTVDKKIDEMNKKGEPHKR